MTGWQPIIWPSLSSHPSAFGYVLMSPGPSILLRDFCPHPLQGFVALELLHEVEMMPRDGFLRHLCIGGTKVLSDSSASALAQKIPLIWQTAHRE
jgi:hypothetical protein